MRDTFIAGIFLAHNAILATRNIRHLAIYLSPSSILGTGKPEVKNVAFFISPIHPNF